MACFSLMALPAPAFGRGNAAPKAPAATAVVSLLPTSGPAAGPVSLVIEGSGFEAGAAVTIGGISATNVTVVSSDRITATTPPLAPGTLNDVTVTNPDSTNATLPDGFFADFSDLPQAQPFHASVERILRAGITAGCGGGSYCTPSPVSRAQMAVFMLKAEHGAAYVPPPCTGIFSDVPCAPAPAFAVDWIEQLFHEGITAGCGPGVFCPAAPVQRSQMAVFLLKTLHGSGYLPPACAGIFTDVPCPGPFADWIEDLHNSGVAAGCNVNPPMYCPTEIATRGQMAVFLVKTFDLPPPPVSSYDWPQYHFEPGHGGNDPVEALVSRDNVASLARLFSVPLPEIADGAPIVVVGVATSSGPRDLVLNTTMPGRLTALDAKTGSVVWETTPPTGRDCSTVSPDWPQYHFEPRDTAATTPSKRSSRATTSPPICTTSSPALDPGRQYVYSYGLDGFVHKYNVGDGTEVTSGGWPELSTLKPDVEKGSSSLAVATAASGTSYLYSTHSSYEDVGDYQGHVTAIRLSDGAQNVFNTLCSDLTIHFIENGDPTNDCSHVGSGVWGRVGVVYDARTDKIYATTGNGDFDANAGGHEWGDSVLALSPDGTGANGLPVDSYTPTNYSFLQGMDLDLGSTEPVLLPVTDTRVVTALGLQTGKDSQIRLIDLADLSRQGGPGHVGGELQILPVPQGDEVRTAPAVWVDPSDNSTWVFIVNDPGISGFQLTFDVNGNPVLVPRWTNATGGASPIVVNGIVFYAGNNLISALDPTTGDVLWSDGGIGGIHWESPVLANGILYITDESGNLTAYAPGGVAP